MDWTKGERMKSSEKSSQVTNFKFVSWFELARVVDGRYLNFSILLMDAMLEFKFCHFVSNVEETKASGMIMLTYGPEIK